MSDLFSEYERELVGILAAFSSGHSKGVTIDGLVGEAECLIWKMSSEARSSHPQRKEDLLGKVVCKP